MSEDIKMDGSEDGNESESERAVNVECNGEGCVEEYEKYGLFRKNASFVVQDCYVKSLKCMMNAKDEEDIEKEEEKECSINSIDCMDSWLITVVDCLSINIKRGGCRQKEYVAN